MKHFIAMLVIVIALVFSGATRAAPAYASNIAYFDYDGNLVGQKIQWCNNKRMSQGNVSSQYRRRDWYLCYPFISPIDGYVCTTTIDGQNVECEWISYRPAETVIIATDDGNRLPPGMTVADSCVLTRDCSPPPPEPVVYGNVIP